MSDDIKARAAELEKRRAKMLDEWDQVVRQIIAKSKGIEPGKVEMPIPTHGRYVVYALDKYGRFSLPRPKGRRRPHWHPRSNALKSRIIGIFSTMFEQHFREQAVEAAKEGKTFEGLSEAYVMGLFTLARMQGTKEHNTRIGNANRGRKTRQHVAHQINAGLLRGHDDRRTVSCGA